VCKFAPVRKRAFILFVPKSLDAPRARPEEKKEFVRRKKIKKMQFYAEGKEGIAPTLWNHFLYKYFIATVQLRLHI